MSTDQTVEATFCFVDIAGYTALTESHGELAAADLIEEFSELVRIAIATAGNVQDFIGDCAFIVFPEPVCAIAAVSDLYKLVADRRNFPVVRVGLHHGTALFRKRRYFGSTINLAARVAERATGGQILVTAEVASVLAAAVVPDVGIEHLGPVRLKNVIRSVDLYEITLPMSPREYVIDPVCKMQVDKNRAAGHLHFEDEPYWFCSLSCIESFAGNPSMYVN